MKNKIFKLIGFTIIVLLVASCNENKKTEGVVKLSEVEYSKPFKKSDPNRAGYVPDEETAIRIAEAIWLPIYGEKIRNSKPFNASLSGDTIGVVSGTVHTSEGGSPVAYILKKDGRIIDVYHEK